MRLEVGGRLDLTRCRAGPPGAARGRTRATRRTRRFSSNSGLPSEADAGRMVAIVRESASARAPRASPQRLAAPMRHLFICTLLCLLPIAALAQTTGSPPQPRQAKGSDLSTTFRVGA